MTKSLVLKSDVKKYLQNQEREQVGGNTALEAQLDKWKEQNKD